MKKKDLAAEKTYNNLELSVTQALEYRRNRFDGVASCTKNETLGAIMERIVNKEVNFFSISRDLAFSTESIGPFSNINIFVLDQFRTDFQSFPLLNLFLYSIIKHSNNNTDLNPVLKSGSSDRRRI